MFKSRPARKAHIKDAHQASVKHRGVLIAEKGNQGFPCPVCKVEFSARNLGRHPHVVKMKKEIDTRLGGPGGSSAPSPSLSLSQLPGTPPVALITIWNWYTAAVYHGPPLFFRKYNAD